MQSSGVGPAALLDAACCLNNLAAVDFDGSEAHSQRVLVRQAWLSSSAAHPQHRRALSHLFLPPVEHRRRRHHFW